MKHSRLLLSRLSRDIVTERAGELRFTQGLLCAKKSTRVVALILSHLLEPVLLGEGSEKGGDLLGY